MTTVAFVERPNFYSAGIAIARSDVTILALGNLALIVVFLIAKFFLWVFFGELRVLEREHLYERTWFTITESFLALTVFRDDFTYKLGTFFVLLMMFRVFHWVARDRVDLMFHSLNPPSLYLKLRMAAALVLAAVLDLKLINFCYQQAFREVPGIMMMFTIQFCLQFISAINSAGTYVLNLLESEYLQQHEEEDTWEPKGLGNFIVSAVTDFLRLILYVLMFVFMIKPFGIPLHIIGDMYMCTRDLVRTVRDFVKFLRARSQMERDMADAIDQDLVRDPVCIICREDMEIRADQAKRYVPKRLSCGHVIHYGCLKSWLVRSQRCPTCRSPVMGENSNQRGSTTGTGPAAPQPEARPIPPEETGARPVDTDNSEGTTPTTSTDTQEPSSASSNSDQISIDSANMHLPHGWKAFKARRLAHGSLEIQMNATNTIALKGDIPS